jgi:predicted Zn-dependent protease
VIDGGPDAELDINERYHSTMRKVLLFAVLVMFSSTARTDELPELGDVSRTTITLQQERQLGESIMRQIRASPLYLDDPEVTDYINALGYRLVANAPNVETRSRCRAPLSVCTPG